MKHKLLSVILMVVLLLCLIGCDESSSTISKHRGPLPQHTIIFMVTMLTLWAIAKFHISKKSLDLRKEKNF